MSNHNSVNNSKKACAENGSPLVSQPPNPEGKFYKDFNLYFQTMMRMAKDTNNEINVLGDNFFHTCYEELVSLYGKYNSPISVEENSYGQLNGDPEERWRTALRFAINHQGDCTYTEGFAIVDGEELPIEHAWATDKKTGMVIDPTFGDKGLAYFGIQFNLDYVVKKSKEAGAAGLLQSENDLETKSPILQFGLPAEALQK